MSAIRWGTTACVGLDGVTQTEAQDAANRWFGTVCTEPAAEFRLEVPPSLQDKTIAASGVREHSGCTIDNGEMVFDGTEQAYIELPKIDIDFSRGLTIEAWVYYYYELPDEG